MKCKLIVSACAAAMAAFAGSASAQVVNPFDAPQVRLYVSGASAPQNTLGAIATNMFQPGFHVYQDNGGGTASTSDDGRLYRAYFGRLKNDASVPAAIRNKTALILNRAKGGSVWGVNPVARAEAIATMPITAANCPVLSGGIYRCNEQGNDLTPTAANEVPDAGVSDVAPQFFLDPLNVEFGATQLTAAEASRLTSTALYGLGMGYVATQTVPASTVLTRAHLTGMAIGNIADWSQVDPSLSGGVVVCRRVPGSGTQASYNWFLTNFPCGVGQVSGDAKAADPLTMADSTGGYTRMSGTSADPDIVAYDPAGVTIVENSSSGQVRACLQAANNGTTHTFTDGEGRTARIAFGAPAKAVGWLSLDSAGSGGDGVEWTFRNANGSGSYNTVTQAPIVAGSGIAPSVANMRSGAYEFTVELTGQYRNATVSGIPALSGDKKVLADEFFARLGEKDTLNGISSAGVRNSSVALPIGANAGVVDPKVAIGTRFGNMCGMVVPQ